LKSETRQQRFKPTALSPAVAYRKDVETRKGPIGKDDGSWIVISTIVGHIAYAHGRERRRFLDDAAKMAAELFDPAALAYGCALDPPKVDRRSSIAVLRLLAERMEYAGTLNLATSLLQGLAGVLPADSVNAGRVLAQRARLSWKAGKTDLAQARYQHLRRKAQKLRNNELAIRSWAGFTAVAQLRGNYPQVQRWASRVVDLASRSGYRRLTGPGHHGLMIRAAMLREFDGAISHGWSAFQAAEGNRRIESELLTNVGSVFCAAGHFDAALDAFVSVLAGGPPMHIAAPALGGYALASAGTSDRNAVNWAAAEAITLADANGRRYETASALLDCSTALERIGDGPYASVLRARASTMAQYGGYFELLHTAEVAAANAVAAPTRETLDSASAGVARQIAHLRPAELPERLQFAEA
jgi:hypothetical protein